MNESEKVTDENKSKCLTYSPNECSHQQKLDFAALVKIGGEVNEITLPGLIEGALLLVMLFDNDQLIGTAAVKRPNDSYRKSVFKKAKVGSLADSYPLELGWIVVDPNHRGQGYAGALIEKALNSQCGDIGIYATTKNDRIRALLTEFGFLLLGEPYQSSQNRDVNLTLFARQGIYSSPKTDLGRG